MTNMDVIKYKGLKPAWNGMTPLAVLGMSYVLAFVHFRK